MTDLEYVSSLVARARAAQRIFETYSQERVDEAVRAVGKIIYDNGADLAKMAVEETKMGDYSSKIVKNQAKAKAVWYRMKGVKSRGILEKDEINGIIKVAKPIGVIGCIPPTTNPTMTPMHNAMCALKGGNALIVSPHPRAKGTSTRTCELMRQALAEIGAPEDLIQVIPEPTLALSDLVMKLCDVTIATGGPSVVQAAYSSGKPSFGVGAGNVQTLVDQDVDIQEIAPMIAQSRTYDNGVLCTCEQCIHIHRSQLNEMVTAMEDQGAYYIYAENEVDQLRAKLFPGGSINKECVGASPVFIAELAGLSVPADTKLLLVRIEQHGLAEVLAKEKLCPVICIAPYDTFEEALEHAKANLLVEGAGHSSIVHSHTQAHVELAGEVLPVSRIGVNMVGSSGLGGGLDNGLMPTATLGCGSWGNNSISENLWWTHLVNIARIAYRDVNARIPTDEEIWS